ncbi:MAG: hypothetical protein ACYDHN_01710 [Solirubrobacteraceae bacterium]
MGVSSVEELRRQTANLRRRMDIALQVVEDMERTRAQVNSFLTERIDAARERAEDAEAKLKVLTDG